MLDQKDLAAIRAIMKEEISESEKQMEAVMEKKLSESENLILEEMERTRTILEKQIEHVRKNLDELSQYYRITKLENDNTAMLLKMIDDLSRRVGELEKRTA